MSELTYDIDKIIREYNSPGRVLFALWEVLAPFPQSQLLPEEVTILNGWNVDLAFGNGVLNIVDTGDFDTLALGLSSFESLASPMLVEFADQLKYVFASFSVTLGSGEESLQIGNLTPQERSSLKDALESVERPYLEKLWHEAVIIHALYDFLQCKLSVLRARKQKD